MVADGCQQVEPAAEKYKHSAPGPPQAGGEHYEDNLSDFADHRAGYGAEDVGHETDGEMQLRLYPIP